MLRMVIENDEDGWEAKRNVVTRGRKKTFLYSILYTVSTIAVPMFLNNLDTGACNDTVQAYCGVSAKQRHLFNEFLYILFRDMLWETT